MITSTAIDSMAASKGARPRQVQQSRGADRGKALEKLKVLIVEDEAVIAWALESLVEDLGHEVVDSVYSGERAIASTAKLVPDLALMDINLGKGMSGIEAAEKIRLQEKVPVIFLSAYSDAATRGEIESRVPGAPLLTKPVNAASLKASIIALLRPCH